VLLPALEAAAKANTAASAAAGEAAGASTPAPAGTSWAEKVLQQRLHSITWLLHHTPKAAAAAGVADHALQVPAVPLQCAKQLLAAGMTLTYAQLLHAADSMVARVEVWVQAQHELELQTDIPQAACDICCQVSWHSTLQQQNISGARWPVVGHWPSLIVFSCVC
jgi:hypothetical protein